MMFTKGEWKVYHDSMVGRTGIVAEDGMGFFTRSIADVICNDDSTLEEIEANAHLMAAAPLMYKAGKDGLQSLKLWANQHPDDEVLAMVITQLAYALNKAREAIAEAKEE